MEIPQLDASKYHVLSPSQKKVLAIFAIIFALIVLPVLSFAYFNFAINRPNQTDKEITFEIKGGDNVSMVAKSLYEKGAVNSEFLFTVYMVINGLDERIQAGVYVIKAGTSVKELGEMFQHGKNDYKITFLEGWRVEQFAGAASKGLENISRGKFIELAKEDEGFLFPDTYIVNKDIQEEDLVNLLKKTFDQKTKDVLSDESLAKAGLTRDEVVILASIVEREVSSEEDRPLVAGILLRRLREGEKLGADATVQFVKAEVGRCVEKPADACTESDWWPKELTIDDLSIDSPYNTRKYTGLPPSPISSVSVSALEAVTNAKITDYLFYLTDDEGITHYAKTNAEHEANIAKYLK